MDGLGQNRADTVELIFMDLAEEFQGQVDVAGRHPAHVETVDRQLLLHLADGCKDGFGQFHGNKGSDRRRHIACHRGSVNTGSVRRNLPCEILFLSVSAISRARIRLERGTVGTSRPSNRMVPLFSSA